MKKLQKERFLLIVLLVSQITFAQFGSQEKGDYYFNQFSYARAVVAYEKMLRSNFNEEYAHQRLAECYLLMRDFKKSIPHFEEVIHNANIPSDYYFKYAMALYSNGDLKSAEKWLKKYKKHNKNDSRVKKFLKNGSLSSVVFNSDERYEISPVSFNSKESDFGVFAQNGNLYFSSARKDQVNGQVYGWNVEPWLDLFVIPENDDAATPEKLDGDINTKFHESSLVFSTDYKNDTIVYFTRNNYFKKKKRLDKKKELNLKIFSAIKKDGQWQENKSLKINDDNYSTGHPFVSPDGKRLYFTSDRPGGKGGADIYYCEISEKGELGDPINAGSAINTEGNEMFPFINEEGILFFSSDGHVGYGLLDVFSTIKNEKDEIVDVINLGKPINSPSDDFGFFANKGGITGYISSNREGGMGGDDIYSFQFTPSLSVEGNLTDAVNKLPLDNVTIALYDQASNKKVTEVTSNKDGRYKLFVNRNNNYRIDAVRKTHPIKSVFLDLSKEPNTKKLIVRDITLEPFKDVKILADLNKIYFDFDKSNIRPDAALELDKVVKLMTVTYPEMVIRLESHTDAIGTHSYNDELSERRAKSTYEYLIANGVSKSHIISYKGFGKRKPINDCIGRNDCTDAELELNRRTEFPIIQIENPTNK